MVLLDEMDAQATSAEDTVLGLPGLVEVLYHRSFRQILKDCPARRWEVRLPGVDLVVG